MNLIIGFTPLSIKLFISSRLVICFNSKLIFINPDSYNTIKNSSTFLVKSSSVEER